MSGHKCAYYNCGLSTRLDRNIRRFSFPLRDPLRCRQWILNSGNIGLENLSPKSLKKRFICNRHFSAEYTTSLRLPLTAIPLKYSDNTQIEEVNSIKMSVSPKFTSGAINVYPPARKIDFSDPSTSHTLTLDVNNSSEYNSWLVDLPSDRTREKLSEENNSSEDKSWNMQLMDLPSKEEFEDKAREKSNEIEIKCLKDKLRKARKKNNNLNTKLREAKKKIMKLQVYGKVHADTTVLPEFSRALVQMQLKSKNRRFWSSDEKKTALSIFYKDPDTYKFLRRKQVVLPSVSTLRKWEPSIRATMF